MHQIIQTTVLLICFPFLACNSTAQKEQELPHNKTQKKNTTNRSTMNNYKDTDVVIKLELTPGSPGSNSYYYSIYGDGSYTSLHEEGGAITKVTLQQILEKANSIRFSNLIENKTPLLFVHDGQQVNLSIWDNGLLKKGEFGYGNPIPEEIEDLIDFILSKLDNRAIEFKPQVNYSDKDVIIKITKNPGGPNSRHTNLSILGDGTCITDIFSPDGKKKSLNKEELKEIFERAQKAGIFKEEGVTEFPKKEKTQIVHDGPSTSVSLWYNGTLKTEMSGHGRSMKPGTMEIINYIFHSLEFDYKPSDIILQIELTPGDPNSEHYHLSIFGSGKYSYSNSKESKVQLIETEGYITKDDIIKIFNLANQDSYRQAVYENSIESKLNSSGAQQTNISIWRNHELKKEIFEEKTASLPAIKEFIDFTFHTIKKK